MGQAARQGLDAITRRTGLACHSSWLLTWAAHVRVFPASLANARFCLPFWDRQIDMIVLSHSHDDHLRDRTHAVGRAAPTQGKCGAEPC